MEVVSIPALSEFRRAKLGMMTRDIAAVVGIFVYLLLNVLLIAMKKKSSAKKRCMNCKIVKRRGALHVICDNPRHKARQGNKQRTKAAG